MNGLVGHIKRILFRKKWRRLNKHNGTSACNIFNENLVQVGKGTYGGILVFNDVIERHLIIGNYCSIASNVVFLLGHDHRLDGISTFPYKTENLHMQKSEAISKGDIIIDDDVWFGYGVTVMSGLHVGQGAVIAAGAVVTRDISPYAIVGGVPAKVIKYRFPPEMIEELLKVDFSKLTDEMIKNHIDELYEELSDVKQLEWLPKKDGCCCSRNRATKCKTEKLRDIKGLE